MKKIALLVLLFTTLNSYAKEFYEDLSPTQRHELAKSYRKTGERFIELGQRSRGKYYLNLADKMDAANIKNGSKDTDMIISKVIEDAEEASDNVVSTPRPLNDFHFLQDDPITPHPLPHRTDLDQYPSNLAAWPPLPSDPNGVSLALFNRYLAALVTENMELMLSVFAHTMALPGYEQGLNAPDIELFYRELFTAFQFNNVNINEIYQMDSINVKVLDDTRSMIIIQSLAKAPPALADWRYWDSFWGTTHHYFFEQINNRWGMIAFDIAYE